MATDTQLPNTPSPDESANLDANQAADLIRQKVARIYGEEPNARDEINEIQHEPVISKHQKFMQELTSSGKDFAYIQTQWHNYYIGLPANEKHQVWQEFYQSSTSIPTPSTDPPHPQAIAEHKHQAASGPRQKRAATKRKLADVRSPAELQSAIRDKVSSGGKLKAKHHFQSLLFGLGMGAIAVLIFLFSFFNEVVIAPFIQPSRVVAATPIITDGTSIAASTTPQVLIPKINVEIPVNYSETSTDENTIENDLESGIVHYPTTVMPGQTGNAAFFGHSSNNIFNQGKYKFAFVLLHTLVPGDTFYLTYNSKVYIYKVITKNIVSPNDVGVLGPVAGQTATATLITCDPPGTSLNRLIIVGQQISPDPSGNVAATTTAATTAAAATTTLPGNGPTLLSRVIHTAAGKVVSIVVVVVLLLLTFRWINGPRRQARRS